MGNEMDAGRPQTVAERLQEFIESIGFTMVGSEGNVFRHKKASPCRCGIQPVIAKSVYKPGAWMAICPNCSCRSVLASNPIRAVKHWNNGDFTELSKQTAHKLTAENMDTGGANNLANALMASAIRDLTEAKRRGNLDCRAADEARAFIRKPKLVQALESGELRRAYAESRKKTKEEDE